ncbi:MAG: hypothetical protein IT162_10315 [Bryobacterales bacterium]|nr:hypothetical protein [Bryobacterales bacterium]
MRTAHFLPIFGLALFNAAATALAAPYAVVSETTTVHPLPIIGELRLTDTVIQDGPIALNRFRMHRLRRPNIIPQGAVLLMPSLGNSFRGYLTHETGDLTKSFAAVLARAGYEVWGYSPRETGLAPGACGVTLDCSPALDWSIKTVIEDATYIRSRIKSIFPAKDPVIGGLSLGAITAIAVVNEHPKHYAGLLAWEGSPVTSDAAVMAHNAGFCAQYNVLVGAGVAVDDQSLPFVKALAALADTQPNAPFALPVAGFPPGLTNRQAFVLVMSTPNPIAPSPRNGFITAAGDFLSGTLFFSDAKRLTTAIASFNNVTANRVGRDYHCSLAGVETAYTANLKHFKEPVMIIKAGQGFGSIMDELPAKLGSAAVTFTGINAWAHVDHLGSPAHALVLEMPVLLWLNTVL